MRMHDEEGVDVRLSTKVEGARGNGAVEELVLERGERLACDAVVVGIGVGPGRRVARGSGLDTDGVLTDHAGRTPSPACSRRATSPGASTTASASTAAASTGTRPPARVRRSPGRSPATSRNRIRCRSSGATSTACGSSTSATRMEPTGPGSRASPANATSPSSTRASERPVGALVVGSPRAFARLRKEIERTYDQPTNEKE